MNTFVHFILRPQPQQQHQLFVLGILDIIIFHTSVHLHLIFYKRLMAGENCRKYFDFSPYDKKRTNGLCNLCKQNYKDQNGVSSNFLKHLKRVHPIQYDQIFVREDEYSPEKRSY